MALVDQISEIANRHGLPVIEDSAQSLGSTLRDKHTGTFFDLGCFSMYPSKVMTAGEGGFIVTSNKDLHDRMLLLRNHGMVSNHAQTFGLNLRLPEINAAIANIQMKRLPRFLKTRKRNASYLTDLILDLDVQIPNERKHVQVNWYLYTVATPKRDKILEQLNQKGIGAAIYYSQPVHKTTFYKKSGKLPVTDWAASRVLSLPVHPLVSKAAIESIAKTIRDTA